MLFQVSELLANFSCVTYGIAGITAAIVIVAGLSRGPNLNAIPTVGSSGWLGPWWAGLKRLIISTDIIQEGYYKHESAPFKVAENYRWMVILSTREHIEEIRRAPDEVLSSEEAANELFSPKYIMGSVASENRSHAAVIRSQLTRNLGTLYPGIRDEVVTAFNDVLDLKGNEWKAVPALNITQQVVCRTNNRALVGLPLCRDQDWIDLNIQHAINIFKAIFALGLLPGFIRFLAAYFLTSAVRRGRARGLKLVGPMIEERLKCLNKYGNEWDGKPNDLISWLIDEVEDSQLTVKSLAWRVMAINFVGFQTTVTSFATALSYLVANPQYIRPLREEVETVIEKEGWSKDSLSKMHKVDSFLRECQRLEGTGTLSLLRQASKDFTFSDGTFIPKGTLIGVASRCLHRDERVYENANVFRPFRFADMRKEDGEDARFQFASTGLEYLPFGHGKQACPGRFFLANELKSMLAHVVVTYDVKLEDDATRPYNLAYGTAFTANPDTRLLFRNRVD